MHISYAKVKRYTEDIKGGRSRTMMSEELIEEIREMVKKTRTKTAIATGFQIRPRQVFYHTSDILIRDPQKPGLSGERTEFLQEIMKNGYALPSKRNTYTNYKILRMKFPNIRRVKMHGKIIYFLEDKAKLACKKFLKNLPKKISNYHVLKQVIDVFKAPFKKEEKKQYIK
jgi:hypothetical protein